VRENRTHGSEGGGALPLRPLQKSEHRHDCSTGASVHYAPVRALVLRLRPTDRSGEVWMPAFAGMTSFVDVTGVPATVIPADAGIQKSEHRHDCSTGASVHYAPVRALGLHEGVAGALHSVMPANVGIQTTQSC